MNTSNKALIALENYSTSKPHVSRSGQDVSFEVEYDDNYMAVAVEMVWSNRYDELVIDNIHAECFNEDDSEVDITNLDLSALVIDVFESNNTFCEVEQNMREDYRSDYL